MPHAIELFFDETTANAIYAAWRTLAPVTDSAYMVNNGVRPHIALAVLESCTEDVMDDLSALAEETPTFSATAAGIDSFPTAPAVVYVGFECRAGLAAIHERVQRLVSERGLVCHSHYRSGTWKPHCTLAMEFVRARLTEAVATASELDLRLPFKIEVVGTVEYPPTRITWERRLGGQHPVAGYGSQTRLT